MSGARIESAWLPTTQAGWDALIEDVLAKHLAQGARQDLRSAEVHLCRAPKVRVRVYLDGALVDLPDACAEDLTTVCSAMPVRPCRSHVSGTAATLLRSDAWEVAKSADHRSSATLAAARRAAGPEIEIEAFLEKAREQGHGAKTMRDGRQA